MAPVSHYLFMLIAGAYMPPMHTTGDGMPPRASSNHAPAYEAAGCVLLSVPGDAHQWCSYADLFATFAASALATPHTGSPILLVKIRSIYSREMIPQASLCLRYLRGPPAL